MTECDGGLWWLNTHSFVVFFNFKANGGSDFDDLKIDRFILTSFILAKTD